MYVFNLCRLYKKPRVIIHANLAFSMLVGQLIFVFGIDTAPKVGNNSNFWEDLIYVSGFLSLKGIGEYSLLIYAMQSYRIANKT